MTYEQFLESVEEVMQDPDGSFTRRMVAWIDRYTELEIAGETRDKAKEQAFRELTKPPETRQVLR